MGRLGGRVAFVTGGARGIGRAIVEKFSAEGAAVTFIDLDDAAGRESSRALSDNGAQGDFRRADVTAESEVQRAIEGVAAAHGTIDVLVNNAGVNSYFDATDMTEAEWDRVFAVDLKGAWLCAKHALRVMKRSGRGSIVNIASIHATLTMAGMFPYADAKSGTIGLTCSLALDYAPARHPRQRRAARMDTHAAGRGVVCDAAGSGGGGAPRPGGSPAAAHRHAGGDRQFRRLRRLGRSVGRHRRRPGRRLRPGRAVCHVGPCLQRKTGGDMRTTDSILKDLALPARDAYDLPASRQRFADGGQYRIEIPSCEGPRAMDSIVVAAREHAVSIHRVSQGSGVMLQTDDEIRRMVALGREHGIEVSLFVGPRANWDVGVQAASAAGKVLGSSLRGVDQLVYGIEDVRHAAGLGIRSVLVADIGQLMILGRMKKAGDLPPDFVLKISVTLAAANPATARVLEDLGATSVNLPVDLSLPQIAAIRQVIDAAIDFYIEAPDDFGGTVRYYEIPELVRIAAPIYLKFGMRNAPGLYPSGQHLESTVMALSRERVRRAAIGIAMLRRYAPDSVASPVAVRA
jgi:NADP-dependent 3-hydroxy acid dehydrogenase YdfG